MAEFLFERRIARQCLLEYKSAQAPLDRVMNETLREHRVGSGQRPLIADLVYKVVRFWPTLFGDLAFNPELMDHQRKMDTVFDFVLKRSREDLLQYHEGLKPNFTRDPVQHLRKLHGIPEFLIAEMTEVGTERAIFWHEYVHQCLGEAPTTIRWNETKHSFKEVQQAFGSHELVKSVFLPGSAQLKQRMNLKDVELYQQGHLDIQDESSQLVALLANPQPGDRVLDLCAGAGGKSLHMAELMEGRGEIWAYDISQAKLAELSKRARKQGLSNIRILQQLPSRTEKFDVVLVDAPCSGLGVLRRNPERMQSIKEADILKLERIQRELLEVGIHHLVDHGHLVYATCTLRDRENHQKISQFVQSAGRAWVPIKDKLDKALGRAQADRLLTELKKTPAYKLAGPLSEGALQWGPSSESQASGAWTGDGFFVSLVT